MSLDQNLVDMLKITIVLTPPPPFLKGGVNFHYLPWRGDFEKLKKGGGSMVQGQVFLKDGGWTLPI